MSVLKVKEVIPSFNSRSGADGSVVITSPPVKVAGELAVHTINQVRMCCGKVYTSFDGYLKHIEESPACTSDLVYESGENALVAIHDEEETDDPNFSPIINSVSSLSAVPTHNYDDVEEVDVFEEEPRSVGMDESAEWESGPIQCHLCHITFLTRMDFIRHQAETHSSDFEASGFFPTRQGLLNGSMVNYYDLEGNQEDEQQQNYNQYDGGYFDESEVSINQEFGDADYVNPGLSDNAGSRSLLSSGKPKERRFTCAHCPLTFINSSHKKGHEKICHVPDGYPCDQCSCTFSSPNGVKIHATLVHITQSHQKRAAGLPVNPRPRDRPASRKVYKPKVKVNESGTVPSTRTHIFRCPRCPFTSIFKNELTQHVKIHLKSAKPSGPPPMLQIGCDICTRRFPNLKSLRAHRSIAHQLDTPDDFESMAQFFETTSSSQSDTEESTSSSKLNLHRCAKCDYECKIRIDLRSHERNCHVEDGVQCNKCSCSFKNQSDLDHHKLMVHLEVKQKEPNSSNTSQRGKLTNGLAEALSSAQVPKDKKKPFKCRKCPKTFSRSGAKWSHEKNSHVEDGYVCPTCLCSFVTPQGLSRHITITHVKPNREVLQSIPNLFTTTNSSSNLDLHAEEEDENGEESNEDEYEDVEDAPINLIHCTRCSYTCTVAADLLIHMEISHSAKSYQCDLCPSSFPTKIKLKMHKFNEHKNQTAGSSTSEIGSVAGQQAKLPIHKIKLPIQTLPKKAGVIVPSNESKIEFPCSKCSYVAMYRTELIKHEKSAHVVNGFDCDLCTRSYATDSGLKQHRIIFHKVDGAINKKSVFLKRSHVNGNKDNLLPEHNILDKKKSVRRVLSNFRWSGNKGLLTCNKCDYSTVSKQKLNEHESVAHIPGGVPCDECCCTFRTVHGVKSHKTVMHKNSVDSSHTHKSEESTPSRSPVHYESSAVNSESEESNSTGMSRNRNNLQCPKCPKKCSGQKKMANHMKMCHVEGGYQCSLCPCTFEKLRGMHAHEAQIHKKFIHNDKVQQKQVENIPAVDIPKSPQETQKNPNQLDDDDEDVSNTKGPKKFFCPKCTFVTSSVPWLANHINTAHVIDGFACDLCPRSYKTELGLKAHKATSHKKDLQKQQINTRVSSPSSVVTRKRKREYESSIMEPINKTSKTESSGETNNNSNISSKSKVNRPKMQLNGIPRGPKYRPMKCDTCRKICYGPENLSFHKVRCDLAHGIKHERKRCPDCPCIFRSEKELDDHARIVHAIKKVQQSEEDEEEEGATNSECDFTTWEKAGLKSHRCNRCSYSTEFISNMYAHFKTSHTGGEFNCIRCSCTFRMKMHLVYHNNYFHTRRGDKIRSRTASQMGGSSSSEVTYDSGYDRKIHSCGAAFSDAKDAIKCILCKQQFNRNNYDKHISQCHSQLKTASKCDKCACTYATRSELEKHIKWSHKGASKIIPSTSAASQSESKPWKCNKCGVAFAHESDLERHKEVSHTSKDYPCVICCCTFATIYGVDCHITGAHNFDWDLPPRRLVDEEEEEVEKKFVPNFVEGMQSEESNQQSTESSTSQKVESDEEMEEEEDEPPMPELKKMIDLEEDDEESGSVTSGSRQSRRSENISTGKESESENEPQSNVFRKRKKRGVGPGRKKFTSTQFVKSKEPSVDYTLTKSKLIKLKNNVSINKENSEEEQSVSPATTEEINGCSSSSESIKSSVKSSQSVNMGQKSGKSIKKIFTSESESTDVDMNAPLIIRRRSDDTDESEADNAAVRDSPVNNVSEDENNSSSIPTSTHISCGTFGNGKSWKPLLSEKRPKRMSAENALRMMGRILEEETDRLGDSSGVEDEDELDGNNEGEEKQVHRKRVLVTEDSSKNSRKASRMDITTSIQKRADGSSRSVTVMNFEEISETRRTCSSPTVIDIPKSTDSMMSNDESSSSWNSNATVPKTSWYKEFMKYGCCRCGKEFVANIALTKHIQKCNGQVKVFPCKLCAQVFPSLVQLKDHYWKIHKPQYEKETGNVTRLPGNANGPDMYNCQLCKQGFKERKTFILHTSIPHMFRCKKCGFNCRTKTAIEKHKLECQINYSPSASTILLNNQNETNRKDQSESTTRKVNGNHNNHGPFSRRRCRCGWQYKSISDYKHHRNTCSAVRVSVQPSSVREASSLDAVSIVFEGSTTEVNENQKCKAKCDPNDANPCSCSICSSSSLKSKSGSIESVEEVAENEKKLPNEEPVNSPPELAECNESMICDECGYLANDVEDAQAHHNAIENDASLICDICAYYASTQCDSVLHSKTHIGMEANNTCSDESSPPHSISSSATEIVEDSNCQSYDPSQPFELEVEFQSVQDNSDLVSSKAVGTEIMDMSNANDLVLFDMSELASVGASEVTLNLSSVPVSSTRNIKSSTSTTTNSV